MTPAWILDLLAVVMLAIAAVSATQLAGSWLHRRGPAVTETGIVHLLMAIAVAEMLASGLTVLPDTIWKVIFGLLTAWFGLRMVRDARVDGLRALPGECSVQHLVHCAAMLYMLLGLVAQPAGGNSGIGGMDGTGGATTLQCPTLALAFALALVGYSIRDLDQLSSRCHSLFYARVTLGCRIAIGVTMALVLVLML